MLSENLDSLNLLPYNFVKENKVFDEQNNDVITVYHANDFCPELFQEIRRFLQSPFFIKQCSQDEFDKLITSSFSASTVNNELPEELKDDFEINPYFTTTNNDEDLILYFGVRGKLYWDYYKSYENLIDFLQESNIDIKNYGFISIGEEYEDVQFYGYYYDYGLEYNRSITIE